MSNTPVEPSLWYRVECLVEGCAWARTYRGSGTVPTCPHALHFMETGHDKLTSGLVGARIKAPDYQIPIEFNEAEWEAAIAFSAGCQYGSINTGRDIKKRVIAALPDEDHLAKGRERDERTIEDVEQYKREVQGHEARIGDRWRFHTRFLAPGPGNQAWNPGDVVTISAHSLSGWPVGVLAQYAERIL